MSRCALVYAASASQRSRSCALTFASRTSRSPWQARGAHQHPSTRPRSSSSAAISTGLRLSQFPYSAMHSPRWPCLPTTNRVAPLARATDVNVVALALAMHRTRPAERYLGRDE
jgi:hypothetical protein